MALNPVGAAQTAPLDNTKLTFKQRTDTIRVVAVGGAAYVAIGTNPTASSANFLVVTGEPENISLGKPRSMTANGVTTVAGDIGSTAIISLPEGTGSPFAVGDAVTLTVPDQDYYNFTNKIVLSVDSIVGGGAGIDGTFNTRVRVNNAYSAGIATAFTAGNDADLRSSVSVAALKQGTSGGMVHVQQIQTSGGA